MKSEDNTTRIFIAIPPPQEVIIFQEKLRNINLHLKKIKWMRSNNIHLTIYFIGNINRENLKNVSEIIHLVIEKQTPFTLSFHELCFAPSKKPRMIWAKYHKHDSFSSFSANIHHALTKLIPNNKFYYNNPIPHITLARFHSMKNYTDISFPDPVVLPDLTINHCELWETVRTDGKSNYHRINSFSFS